MASPTSASSAARALPDWLEELAVSAPDAAALRCKRRGLWHVESWRELHASVSALARGLAAHGFVPGDRLLVDASPSPESLRVALAVLRLGGAIVGGERGLEATEVRFALADDEAARARLVATLSGGVPTLGIVLDGDDAFDASGAWVSLEALVASSQVDGAAASLPPPPSPATAALLRFGRESLTHAQLLRAAHGLLVAGGIDARQRVLASRGLPLAALLASVLGAWLVGGFALSFGETAATEDNDRRELGPHVVFGAERSYADLVARTHEALPSGAGLEARWIARALDGVGIAGRLTRRLLVRRLREVVGLGHLRRPIALDGAGTATAGFERLFGVAPLAWPAPGDVPATAFANVDASADTASAAAALDESAPGVLGPSSRVGLPPALLDASSRSDLA